MPYIYDSVIGEILLEREMCQHEYKIWCPWDYVLWRCIHCDDVVDVTPSDPVRQADLL